jgi:hypothetical protein
MSLSYNESDGTVWASSEELYRMQENLYYEYCAHHCIHSKLYPGCFDTCKVKNEYGIYIK